MWPTPEHICCECGEEFAVVFDDARSSIRCHLCGRAIDLAPFKVAAEKRKAAERAIARQTKVDLAGRLNFGGLRFDGVYRTASPLPFDDSLADALELSICFHSNLEAEYDLKALNHENGESIVVDRCVDRTDYQATSFDAIRLTIDAVSWICDWEGYVGDTTLELTYRIEEYGVSSYPKCIREGSLRLWFVPSPE